MMEELTRKAFEYFGALALVIVGLMIALVWVVRKWVAALERIEVMHEARLQAEREHGKIGEAMRDTMAANTTALQGATEIMRATANRRGGD